MEKDERILKHRTDFVTAFYFYIIFKIRYISPRLSRSLIRSIIHFHLLHRHPVLVRLLYVFVTHIYTLYMNEDSFSSEFIPEARTAVCVFFSFFSLFLRFDTTLSEFIIPRN